MNQWNTQVAVVERLKSYEPLCEFVGEQVYDDVPQGTKFPYVVVGEGDSVSYDDDCNTGADSDVTIHVWSRYPGRKEAKQILQTIYDALNRYGLVIEGSNTILLEAEYQETFLDPDGLTRHGVIRFRLLTTHS